MTRIKLVILLVLSLLALIVVLQNTQAVETKLLFVTVTMPRAMLLFLAMLTGFVCGVLVSIMIGKKRAKQPSP